MSGIKFKHVFSALLALSALSAFVLPERFSTKAQPQVQSLFYPVARPVRSLAGWVDGRVAKPAVRDGRDAQALWEENESLRQDVLTLSQALDELRRRNAERELLGRVKDFCTPFGAFGVDAGGREGLLIRGSTLDGLRQGQYVLFWGGVVGTLDRPPGLAGAEVRLVTDKGVRVGACFMRANKDEKGKLTGWTRLKTPPALVEGIGAGAIRCATDLTLAEIKDADVQVGDRAVIEDNDWDRRLQGYCLGNVTYIGPQAAAPLYSDIRIEPLTNLMRLRDVMVMTK